MATADTAPSTSAPAAPPVGTPEAPAPTALAGDTDTRYDLTAEDIAAGANAKPEVTAEGDDADKTPTTEVKPAEGEAAKPKEGEEPAVETKPEDKADAKADEVPAEKADETPDVKAARKIYTAAARREAEALRAERANKALAVKVERLEKVLSTADEDPLSVLQALGFGKGTEKDPVKDLLQKVVAKGEKPAPTPEERIAQLEERIAAKEARTEEQKQLDLVERHQGFVTTAVKAAGDKFDLVNAFDAHDQVWAVMVEYHAKHGVALDPLVAADAVEKHLQARISKSTKFKAPAGAPAAAAAVAKPATTSTGKPPTSAATGKSETLTNTEPGQVPITAAELPNEHGDRFAAVAREFGFGAIH